MSTINSSIFKAYDIRGIYPQDFNEETAYDIGRAYLDYIRSAEKIEEPKIVVGRDARLSSPAIFKGLTEGIINQGADVFDIGFATTPMLYFAINFLGAQGGIMITASHNPPEYNGLKMDREKAIPISGDSGLDIIQEKVLGRNFAEGKNKQAILSESIKEYYIDFLTKDAQIDFKGKIVIDAGNGMTPLILPEVLSRLKIDYIPLYFDIDGAFPNHEANPLKEETLEVLKKTVKKEKALLGVAFDGDGDRVVFITEKGEVISGDFLTAILTENVLKNNPGGKVIYDLRSTRILVETIKKAGGEPIITKVGYPNIRKLMREQEAVLGGEISSHIYFPFQFPLGVSYFESGIYTMIKFLEILAKTKKKPSALLLPLKKYVNSGEINFKVENKERVLSKIEEVYQKEAEFLKIDGLSVDVKRGKDWFWFNVRPSNTEPLLRMILEASRKTIFDEELKNLSNLIASLGGTRA